MNPVNYEREMEKILESLKGRTPSLLLHACCAPCSSSVLERLSSFFKITIFYYNPNISPEEEYRKRVEEEKRLISEMPFPNPVGFLEGKYDPERFLELAKGKEQEPEGGARCMACYALRLRETALQAREGDFQYFTTTLSVSPYKNARKLNEIGARMAETYGVPYLYSDFKKKNGYLRSIELSRKYSLYRQDYCGCIYSKENKKKS